MLVMVVVFGYCRKESGIRVMGILVVVCGVLVRLLLVMVVLLVMLVMVVMLVVLVVFTKA